MTAFLARPFDDQRSDPRNHWGDTLALKASMAP
jgi:hypothetical protein